MSKFESYLSWHAKCIREMSRPRDIILAMTGFFYDYFLLPLWVFCPIFWTIVTSRVKGVFVVSHWGETIGCFLFFCSRLPLNEEQICCTDLKMSLCVLTTCQNSYVSILATKRPFYICVRHFIKNVILQYFSYLIRSCKQLPEEH